jgi:hypothetical protein
VILCVPVGICGQVAEQIAGSLKPGAIVSDVGSVKAAVLEQAHGMQVVCAEMHRVGLRVDQKRRAEYEVQQKLRAWEWKTLACDIAGSSAHNPSSVQQVRSLLFERWQLEIPMGANGRPKITAAGDPSTDDEAINALREYDGDVSAIAAVWDMHRQTVYRYLKKYGITANNVRPRRVRPDAEELRALAEVAPSRTELATWLGVDRRTACRWLEEIGATLGGVP